MNRVRLAFSLLFVCGLSVTAAAASPDAVRFTASAGVVQMRVEVLSPSGTALYDSDWKSGNVFDWTMPVLPYGSYSVRIQSRDLEGRASEKQTTLHVAPEGITVDAAAGNDLKLTTTLHDGETGQLVTTSGDLSFRFGDFLSRKDTEAMRLSAEGNLGIGTDKPQARLDVNGLIRTSEGIMFPDGSIQRSAALPSIVRMRPSNPEADKKLHPKGEISGTGTTNQMTKWGDGPGGVVADSAVAEVGGKVGIGTTNPGGQLHIYGIAGNDIFAGMGPDVINGPGFNYGYAGNSFGVGAGFFNVRPAMGATGVNPSLRFMTVDQQRMIITNAGNVGIGTSAPTQRLDVVGSVTLSGNLALPATTSASVGVIALGGNRFAHNFGTDNTFLGANAGNLTMSGLGANTASGSYALYSNTTGYYNTASGFGALSLNTTGNNNTASGSYALYYNTTGNANTAIGQGALISNTTGIQNTGSGVAALSLNTTGYNNTASGHSALFSNTTGYGNTANGFGALYSNTTGQGNTASGYQALYSFNNNQYGNTASGYQALYHDTGGELNTASGYQALYNNQGNFNIAVGNYAGASLTVGDFNIDIGNSGVAGEANTIRIGTGNQTRAFIAGISGVTTGGAAVAVLVDGNGQLGTVSSSRRYKFDIASMGEATDGLMRLRPVSFRYHAHGQNAPLQYGLIAEEVAEVYPELVTRNKDGEVETVMYQFLAPMLLNEVQKQRRRIEEQQAENATLRDQFEKLMRRVEQLEVTRTAAQ